MGLDDYVIACRSYKRANVFPHKTYRMLAHNGLTDRLYIFVANQEEKECDQNIDEHGPNLLEADSTKTAF